MSELKVYVRPLKTNILGQTIVGQSYYLKSEADKVIAELKMTCNDKVNWCLHTLKENRHHKYKRCLAMAEMCSARYDAEYKNVNGYGASWEYISKEMIYWERWHKCWLKLAQKFK